jgi:hypothetical protein
VDSTRDKGGGAWPLGVPGRDVDDITKELGDSRTTRRRGLLGKPLE